MSTNNFLVLEKEIKKVLDLVRELRQENEYLRGKLKAMQEGSLLFDEVKKENFALQKKQEVLKLKIEKILQKLSSVRIERDSEDKSA